MGHDLDRPNVTVKVQEDFIATGTETLDKLDEYIRQCDAVIHLVGDMTGALPKSSAVTAIRQRYPRLAERLPVLGPFLEPDSPAISYTQWEAWLALYHGKVLIIAVPQDGTPREERYKLDKDQCASQQAHLERLSSVGRYPEIRFANADRLAVEMLRSKLQDILPLPSRPAGLWNVPDLPLNFVPRHGELKALKTLIKQGPVNTPVGITSSAIRIGLLGMGGIGKSVLAVALARDETDVGVIFPDGIIWLTFGPQAKPTSKQCELFHALGEPVPTFETWEEGRAELGSVTAKRRCLIILDDIWESVHAEAFTQLGRDCRVLVTTRNANVLNKIGAASYDVGVLPLETAWREFLPQVSGDYKPPLAARDVAKACGCLPLALALIGALIRDRIYTWEKARDALEASSIEELYAELPSYEHRSVYAAVHLSVQALHQHEHEALLRCVVFQEDASLPMATLETLWSECLPADEMVRTRRTLVERSLLSRTTEAGDRYGFHDVIHHYFVANARHSHQLQTRHRQLVNAYCALCQDGWHTGPDDGYYFQFLAYHLQQAGEVEMLRDLLLDYAWLWRKGEITGVTGLITDCARLSEDGDVQVLHQALRLAAFTLQADWGQLPSQLFGRLLDYPDHPRLQVVLRQAAAHKQGPWLRPLMASLQPPGGHLVQDLRGHIDVVASVVLTAEGRHAVSASWDTYLKVWDLVSGACIHTLEGHTRSVKLVALTPDSRYAISASDDKTLRVWDLALGTCVHTLKGHKKLINALVVTPEGRHAASSSMDKTVKVWDLNSGVCVHTLSHERDVATVGFTPDGRHVVSASQKILNVWDTVSGSCVRTLEGHTRRVDCLAFTSDGRHLVSASADYSLKVWDLASGTCVRTMRGHARKVNAVVLTGDGRHAISASSDYTLKLWDLTSGMCIHTLRGHTFWVGDVALTTDERHAVSASGDKTLKVWDLASGTCVETLKGHISYIGAVVLTPDGRCAVSASGDKTLKVWDLTSDITIDILKGHAETKTLAITPDGRRAVSASWNDNLNLKVWDLGSSASVHSLAGHLGGVMELALTPDSRYAVSASFASWNHNLQVWDLVTGNCVHTLKGHTGKINVVAVTPDSRHAVSASEDLALRVWDLATGICVQTLQGHTDKINEVSLTSDGRHAVSASDDHTLKVWDLVLGTCVNTLKGHTDKVKAFLKAVALTSNGRHVVSVSYDRTLKVWDWDTGNCVHTLAGHKSWIQNVCLTPDGKYAVSASCDDTLRMWSLATGTCVHILRSPNSDHWCVHSALTPNKHQAVSFSRGQTFFKVWDLASGACIHTLEGHTGRINAVIVSPDGRHAVSASNDQTLKVWHLDTGRLVTTFTCGAPVEHCAISRDEVVVASSSDGGLHILQLVSINAR